MRLVRDDFVPDAPSWNGTLWPYADYNDTSGTNRALRSVAGHMGVITGDDQDYNYWRYYFAGSRVDQGLLVRGRFTTSGSFGIRVHLRASRAGRADGDLTYANTSYSILVSSDNLTVELQRTSNGAGSSLGSFTLPSLVGTNWWNVRMETEGKDIRVKVWTGVSGEPSAWNRTYVDNSPLPAGEPAIGGGYTRNQVTHLDYFETYDFFDLIAVAGSAAPSGTLRKVVRKPVAGAVTASSAFTARRVVTRLFASSVTASGTARRALLRVVGGTITPGATYAVGLISKRLGGVLEASGTGPRRAMRRAVGGAVTPSGRVDTRSVGRILGTPGIVAVTIRVAGQVRSRLRKG